MTKYKHIHLPAKPLTRQIKPCSIDNNYKKKDMTARLGLDGSKSNYGYYNHTLPVILLTSMMVSCSPAYAVTNSAFEMRLQGYPQSDTLYNSERLKKGGYQTEATFTQSQDDFIKYNLDHCSKNNQTEQQLFSISNNINNLQETERQTEHLNATCSDFKLEQKQSLSSPYLGTFSVPQNVKADFLHTLEAMEKRNTFVLFRHVKNLSKPDIETPSNDRQMKKTLTDVKSWGYDGFTTTHIAVKPSRHPLAIFVPIVRGYYPRTTTGANASHTSYDGFGEPNTRAFTVNKFRPLCGVVASRHPMIFSYGDNLLTKHIGGYHA